jgi:hypothetical protein
MLPHLAGNHRHDHHRIRAEHRSPHLALCLVITSRRINLTVPRSRFEDLAHVVSRRPVDHYIEGRWQRDCPSVTSRLQALQLVEGLQELSGQMRLVAGDLLQRVRLWKHAFPPEAIFLGLDSPTEDLGGSLQSLHFIPGFSVL